MGKQKQKKNSKQVNMISAFQVSLNKIESNHLKLVYFVAGWKYDNAVFMKVLHKNLLQQ